MAAGSHPFPFRTRKLSPPAPMVLGGRPPGRVGRRRISNDEDPRSGGGPLSFSPGGTISPMAGSDSRSPRPKKPPRGRTRRAGPTERWREAAGPPYRRPQAEGRRTAPTRASRDRRSGGPSARRGSRRLAEDVRSAGTKPPHQGPRAPRDDDRWVLEETVRHEARGAVDRAKTGRRRPPARRPDPSAPRTGWRRSSPRRRGQGRRCRPRRQGRGTAEGGRQGLRAGSVPDARRILRPS